MKKIIIIFFVFMVLIFLLPAIFTKRQTTEVSVAISEENAENQDMAENSEVENNEVDNNQQGDVNDEPYNYSEYGVIKLLHSKTGEVEEIPLDTYLLGVVSAEMPANYELEALKAQAVVARTYTMYSIKHNNNKHSTADICDDSNCCQAWISKENRLEKWDENVREEYWKKIETAVNSTKGKIITYDGEPIDAFFHSNSGGKTETPVNVWGGTSFPYLQSVQTAGEEGYTQYSSEVILSKEELVNKIKQKHSNFEIDFNKENCIEIVDYTDSNRVRTIRIGNIELSGVELRGILGLKSSNFKVSVNENDVKFEVQGYGHGVGMSQTGADSMAKQGSNYEEIIKHFYIGVEISNC